MPDAFAVATWRFEMIAPLLDPTLTPPEQRQAMRDRTARPVVWPAGELRTISRATLFRWLAAYRSRGLAGLLPKPRKDKGEARTDRSRWIEEAVALLRERPERSLFLVLAMLRAEHPELKLTRSTLHRELVKNPAYKAIQRRRKGSNRLYTRFEAAAPHEIWQLDAKGPFKVRLQSGKVIRVTVLSVLDDHSRALLGVKIAEREELGSAVALFREAAARWGLPARIYCDRHSVYDSFAFRRGLATLGVHRIHTKARAPRARGKIERYHRVLAGWFIAELEHQVVVDLRHLEELLQAFRALYLDHRHRGLKCTPRQQLGDTRSVREVSVDDLRRAFWCDKTCKAHPATGEVNIAGALFQVPVAYAGKRVRIRWDPAAPRRVALVADGDAEIALRPLLADPPPARKPPEPQSAPGRLQRLLDRWRGRELPVAEAGFGLPEVFAALDGVVGRAVPRTEREAETIQAFYRTNGPFASAAFRQATDDALAALGPGRPLGVVLAFLTKRVHKPPDEETL